jgi:two-component system OmpR family sensor kinase
MPIRWRLTLWFTLTACIGLLIAGLVLNLLLQRDLYQQVDDTLRVYSAKVHGTLDPKQVPVPLEYAVEHSSLPNIDDLTAPGIYMQFTDRNGNVVLKSKNLGEQELPVSRTLVRDGLGGKVGIDTIAPSAGDSAKVRVMVSPMYVAGDTLVLEVGQALDPVDAIINQVRWALLTGTMFALILAATFGAILARRALAPVRRVADTAAAIEESSDLGRRVSYQGPKDEIGHLVITFNHMIDRLERGFRSQRQLIGDASHELRSPLTVIKGNIELLKRNVGEDGRREALQACETETNRMVKVVGDLLLLAEVDAGQEEFRDDVSLTAIVEEEVSRLRTVAGSRQFRTQSPSDVHMKGNANRLKQLVANLLENAVKYTAEDGMIQTSISRSNGRTRLEVSDNGIGISEEDLPRVFDRFYRTAAARSRQARGTGLGLAIVKAIAEQHGGKVSVTSEPGKGSTFTVEFGS